MKKSDIVLVTSALASAIAKSRTPGIRKSSGDSTIEVVKENYSFIKYLRGTYLGNWDNAQEEHKIYKALNENIGTQGGVFVPEQTSSEIIELLRDKATVRTMPGVQLIPMARDKWSVRRTDTGATSTWGHEAGTMTEDTNPAWGKVTLELKKLKTFYKMSRELLQDADVSMESLVIREIVDNMAITEDLAFLEGTGGDQPTGFYNQTGVVSTDLGASPTYDDILNARYQVMKLKSSGVTGWISNIRTENTLLKLKNSDGDYMYKEGRLTDAGNAVIPTLYGAPVAYTNQIPITLRPDSGESYMVGGKFSDLYIGDSTEGIRIDTTDSGGSAFVDDQVYVKVVKRVDMALRHPESFVVVKGIAA